MKTLIFAIRKITVILILLTLCVTVSCREKTEKEESTTKTSTSDTPILSEDNTTISEDNTSDSNGDIALNPAHGQLGHRCDIKVGAPLNSKPINSGNNTQSGSPLINTGDIKINPAHGQLGHRCDIKVGDPL